MLGGERSQERRLPSSADKGPAHVPSPKSAHSTHCHSGEGLQGLGYERSRKGSVLPSGKQGGWAEEGRRQARPPAQ